MNNAKEHILKKINQALENRNATGKKMNFDTVPDSFFVPDSNSLDKQFIQNIEKVDGNAFICADKSEFSEKLKSLCNDLDSLPLLCSDEKICRFLREENIPFVNETEIEKAQAGISSCEFLVAQTGSVLVSSQQTPGRKIPAYSPVHIVVAYKWQLKASLTEALKALNEKYERKPSAITIITGPSRTADIEKTLILGAHGPKKLCVFILDENSIFTEKKSNN